MPTREWSERRAKRQIETTDRSLAEIAANVGASVGALRLWYWKTFSAEFRKDRKKLQYRNSKLGDKNPMKGKVGAEHHNFIGRAADGKGYFTVLKPYWWTGPNKGKRVFEHHVVYALANGLTELPLGMHVHHIDHVRGNNSPGNLELLTPEEHKERHT